MLQEAAAWLAETATRWLFRPGNALLRDSATVLAELAVGVGNFGQRLRHHPEIARGLVRRTLFSAAVRLPVIAACVAAQRYGCGGGGLDRPHLHGVLEAVVVTEQILAVIDVTVVAVTLQRDLGDGVTRHCPEYPVDTALVQQTLTRLAAPMVVGGVAWFTPSYPMTCTLLRGCALGCQVHDAAMATRGVCPKHRTERWCRDGTVMVGLGVAIEASSQQLPACVAPVAAQYLATLATGVVTCQPLVRHRRGRGVDRPWLRMPYAATHQLVERLRRLVVGGVLAPDLERRTSLAVTALRAWSAVNRLGWLLPVEMARPELHYLLAELVTPDALRTALEGMRDLLAAASSPLKRRATRRIPVLSALVSGLPEPVVRAVGDVAADPTGVRAAHAIQRHLAKRLSAASRGKPLTFAEWEAMGIAPGDVAAWDLDAALSETTWVKVGATPGEGTLPPSDWVEEGAEAF